MSEPAAKPLATLDLENMPKPNTSAALQKKPPQQIRLEIVMADSSKNIAFIVENGEVANTFLDSYSKLVESKAAMARWAIGSAMYSIPMERISFVRMERQVALDEPKS